jgi:hypothetical protein
VLGTMDGQECDDGNTALGFGYMESLIGTAWAERWDRADQMCWKECARGDIGAQ